MGYIGRDAEIKTAGSSKVCKFSLAVTTKRRDSESTAWYECSLFGPRGESLAPHLLKGTAVCVVGELVPRQYKGKNDELRMSLDVNVNQFSFAGSKGEQIPQPSPNEAERLKAMAKDIFTQPQPDEDSEIPF